MENNHNSNDILAAQVRDLTEKIENSPTPDADLFLERGNLLWKAGDRGGAISDYERAVAINPDSPAATALEMSRNIMDFYHHDLYNP